MNPVLVKGKVIPLPKVPHTLSVDEICVSYSLKRVIRALQKKESVEQTNCVSNE